MPGTPFLFGPEERDAMRLLSTRAAEAPVNAEGLLQRVQSTYGREKHMRQMRAQTVELSFGFAVTYSIEINHPGGRTARHMSMSSPKAGRLPLPEAVWIVAEALGFTGEEENALENLKLCVVWQENLGDQAAAINVLQFVDQQAPTRA